MSPTKFLPGDLVLVDFPHDGYWPAEIIEVFKNSKREVKCFGEGDRGYANPIDMVIFNSASKKAHLSDSSWKKDPARKKALEQITGKFKEQFLQKKNAEKKQKNEGGAKAMGNGDLKGKKGDNDLAGKKPRKQINGKYKKQFLQNNNDKSIQKNKGGTKAIGNKDMKTKKPAQKKALKQMTGKSKKQFIFIQNNNDESEQKNEGGADEISKKADENKVSDQDIKEIRVKVEAEYEEKFQRHSAEYEKKIADLEAKLREELSAVAGVNKEIEEYKIKLESLEQKFKNHTNHLEDLTIKHKDEISKKVDENKLLNDQIRQLQKEKAQLVEEKLALEKECATHGMSVEESRLGLSPSPHSSRQEPREGIRKRSMGVNESFMGEANEKRKRLDTLNELQNSVVLEVDETNSEEDKRQNLEKGDSSMETEADQSYSDEDNRKRLEEHEFSMDAEESHVGEEKNKSKVLEVEDSYGNTFCRIM